MGEKQSVEEMLKELGGWKTAYEERRKKWKRTEKDENKDKKDKDETLEGLFGEIKTYVSTLKHSKLKAFRAIVRSEAKMAESNLIDNWTVIAAFAAVAISFISDLLKYSLDSKTWLNAVVLGVDLLLLFVIVGIYALCFLHKRGGQQYDRAFYALVESIIEDQLQNS